MEEFGNVCVLILLTLINFTNGEVVASYLHCVDVSLITKSDATDCFKECFCPVQYQYAAKEYGHGHSHQHCYCTNTTLSPATGHTEASCVNPNYAFYSLSDSNSYVSNRGDECTPADTCDNGVTMECVSCSCDCKFPYKIKTSDTTRCELYTKSTLVQMRLPNSDTSSSNVLNLWTLSNVNCGSGSVLRRSDLKDNIDLSCFAMAFIVIRDATGVWLHDITLTSGNIRETSFFCDHTYFNFPSYSGNTDLKCAINQSDFFVLYTSLDESKFYFGIYSAFGSEKMKIYIASNNNVPMGDVSSISTHADVVEAHVATIEAQVYDATQCQYTSSSPLPNCPTDPKPPVVTAPVSTQESVDKGDNVDFDCSYTSTIAVTDVKWFFENEQNVTTEISNALNPTKYSVSVSANNQQMTVSNIEPSDIGSYYCSVSNAHFTTNQEMTALDIIRAPPVIQSQALNSDNPYFISVNQSESVTLSCSFTSYPNATSLVWIRQQGGQESSPSSGAASGTLSSSNLTFSQIDTTDEGNYTCRVTNEMGTSIGNNIHVQVKTVVPMCPCDCNYQDRLDFWKQMNFSSKEMLDFMKPLMEQVKKDMEIDEKSLSSHVRTLTSAPDDRKSSEGIGVMGIVFIVLVFGPFVMFDLIRFIHFLKNYKSANGNR